MSTLSRLTFTDDDAAISAAMRAPSEGEIVFGAGQRRPPPIDLAPRCEISQPIATELEQHAHRLCISVKLESASLLRAHA